MELAEITDQARWDEYVGASPWGHPLQLWGWGEVKRGSNWQPARLALVDGERWLGAAQVLLWPIPRTKWLVAYVPRGPVAEAGSEVAHELMERVAVWAKRQGAIYVRIEPAWQGEGLGWAGWRRAKHQIQMAQTYLIGLEKPEDELLGAIDGKYRYYIRKAERDGAVVRRLPAGELGGMFAMYEETAKRAGFGLHGEAYYRNLSEALGENSWLLVAERGGKPLAFLWLAAAGTTAYELYGGVNQAGRDARVNYFLKWQAIVMMKAAGFAIYDFNGRVSEGVSGFKQNFAPREVDYIGTWDRPLNAVMYVVWESAWPLIKRAGRLVRGRHGR
jgi:lipid II:glycine glycyltransferase (peptidoglycan interpeptide bridge formation enzyme)